MLLLPSHFESYYPEHFSARFQSFCDSAAPKFFGSLTKLCTLGLRTNLQHDLYASQGVKWWPTA